MHSPRQIYLPTEIVLQIVSIAAADETSRQETLYACCLVSRQWYSTAIALLYEKPRVDYGSSFRKFAETISPPIGVRKSKLNLGGLVHRLDLRGLVHHSSNSLTARLLGRVKENLEVFMAPRVSFALNSLPALAKCVNLRHLDLSLAGDPIPFFKLKQAISHLKKLTILRLPQSTVINGPESSIEWPPHLQRLQVSGSFNPLLIPTFSWPPAMTTLILKNCTDLSVSNMGSLISSPHLGHSLRRLIISGANRNLQPESINAIPAFLPGLSTLTVPGDMVDDSFFDMLCHMAPLALELLEFGYPSLEATLSFSTESLIAALHGGLANLRSIGFAEVLCTDERVMEDEEIDEVLVKRNRTHSAEPDDNETDAGVYYV